MENNFKSLCELLFGMEYIFLLWQCCNGVRGKELHFHHLSIKWYQLDHRNLNKKYCTDICDGYIDKIEASSHLSSIIRLKFTLIIALVELEISHSTRRITVNNHILQTIAIIVEIENIIIFTAHCWFNLGSRRYKIFISKHLACKSFCCRIYFEDKLIIFGIY